MAQRIAVVTGANKGIGLAIVRNLALQYPSSALGSGGSPLLIYLTARSSSRGADAVSTLNADPQLTSAKALASHGGPTTITFHTLDISSTSSIHTFRDFLSKTHPDGLDVVINNAGIALEGFDSDVVKETLATNYYGTLEATRAFLPLIRGPHGRLVNVTSMAGKLNKYSTELQAAFKTAADEGDVAAVTGLMERFTTAVAEGREKADGWPSAAYAVSKAGATAMTKVLARDEHPGVLVNACCPGYVNTDMTKARGTKTVDQGAQTPVLLAVGEIGGRNGGFWQEEKEIEW